MKDIKAKPSHSITTIINGNVFPLLVLLIISIAFRLPFVMDGFGEVDAASIAVSIIDWINHGGNAHFSNLYWLDVVPGYALFMKMIMRLFDNNYAYLATIMNYTTFVFGTLIIIPCYFFIKRLFHDAIKRADQRPSAEQ